MGGLFVGATPGHLDNAVMAVTTYPITMAGWAYPTSSGASQMILIGEFTGDVNQDIAIFGTSGNAWGADDAGGTATAGTLTTSKWHFVLGRFIASNNRRISVLHSDGSTAHAQNTTATGATGLNELTIGARRVGSALAFSGTLAEIWWANIDPEPDGGQTSDALLKHLAFKGPFSYPPIAKNIIDYIPMVDNLGTEEYSGPFGRQIWANTGSVILTNHPPLAQNYKRPWQSRRMLTI
jgi:hypothetical protein